MGIEILVSLLLKNNRRVEEKLKLNYSSSLDRIGERRRYINWLNNRIYRAKVKRGWQ